MYTYTVITRTEDNKTRYLSYNRSTDKYYWLQYDGTDFHYEVIKFIGVKVARQFAKLLLKTNYDVRKMMFDKVNTANDNVVLLENSNKLIEIGDIVWLLKEKEKSKKDA